MTSAIAINPETGAPPPGVYYGVPFDEYLSWDAISNTALHAAAISMAHFKCRRPIEPTRPMILGTLTHTARFEASFVNDRFAFMPDFREKANEARVAAGKERSEKPAATNEYKALVAEWEESHKGRVVITEQEFTDLIGIVNALSGDVRAMSFLAGTAYEVSVVAACPITGILCKGRIDCLDTKRGLISDLKTSNDAMSFERAIANFSYHRQLAFYSDLLSWAPEPVEIQRQAIVVVESSEPWCVRSAELDDEAIEAGRDQYRSLLNQIAACARSKTWPGYPNPEKWRLPQWAKPREPVDLVIGGEKVSV